MKSKVPLSLMEQLTMILVFALAAAVCLRLFILANTVSARVAAQEQAVIAVQNTAESLKAARGDFDQLVSLYGGERTENGWKIGCDENGEEAEDAFFTVEAAAFEDEIPLLGSARIVSNDQNGKLLFQIDVSWQEEDHE